MIKTIFESHDWTTALPQNFKRLHPTLHLRNRAIKLMYFAKQVKYDSNAELMAMFNAWVDRRTQYVKPLPVNKVRLRLQMKLIDRLRINRSIKKRKYTSNLDFQSRVTDQVSEIMKQFRLITNDPMQLDLLARVEKLLYLSFTLLTAKDNQERLKHIGSYLVYTSNGSILEKGQKFVNHLVETLFPPNEHEFQSNALREALDNWDRANESTLATKLRAVASYCMAFSLLEKWGLHSEFAEVVYAEFRVEKEKKKVTSFVYAILDVVEFVLSKAKICYDTGSLVPLFHSTSTYLDWFTKVDEVRLMSRMKIGSELSGFKDADYFKLLEECINKGEALVKFAKTNQERKAMSTLLSELKILRHDQMIEQNVSKTREMPFAVLVFGNSSIGKSTITEIFGKHYARVMGLDYDPSIIYYRSSFDQFMSGYTSSKWMIVLDDLACLEPSKCTNGDLSIIDAIQLINCAPYLSNQAELEKKGKVPVLAKLVIANTNVKNLSVFDYFAHPSAVQRRFNFVVTPSVKMEFRQRDSNGNLIDALDGVLAKAWQDKHQPIDGSEQLPDFWDFEILEWLPAPVGKGKQLALEHYPFGNTKLGMRETLDYYEGRILKHIRAQHTMTKNVDGLRKARTCGICHCDRAFCGDRDQHRVFDDIKCLDCNKYDCIYLNYCKKCDKCFTPIARCVCPDKPKSTNLAWLIPHNFRDKDEEVAKFQHLCGGIANLSKLGQISCERCKFEMKVDPKLYTKFDLPHVVWQQVEADVAANPIDLRAELLRAQLADIIGPEMEFQSDVEIQHCGTCGYLDCLWFGNTDHVSSTCDVCKHCLSDEDELDGCTYCLVNGLHQVQSTDSILLVINTLAIVMMLYHMGIRSANPSMQQDITDRFNSIVPSYQRSGYLSSALNTVRNMCISGQERIVTTFSNARDTVVTTSQGIRRTLNSAQRSIALAGTGYHVYTQYLAARESISDFGNRMGKFVSTTVFAGVCAAILAGIAMAKAAFKIHEYYEVQSGVKTAVETVDPWKREKYQLSKLDVGASVHNMRQYTRDQFNQLLLENSLHLDIIANGLKNETKALAFADRYYLVNLHALPQHGDFKVNIYREIVTEGVSQNLHGLVFTQDQITRLKGDIGILFIPHLPPRRNIVELFGGETFKANCNGFYAVREPNTTRSITVKNIESMLYQHPQVDEFKSFHVYNGTLNEDSYKGLCGAALVAETYLGNTILGIHTMGKDKDVLTSRVTCEMLRKFLANKNPIDIAEPIINYSGSAYELQSLHDHSVPNYVEEGTASVYGSLKGHRSSGKSMVEKTIIADYLVKEEGFKVEHGKPVMKGWAPWRLAFLPMSNPNITMPYQLAKECVEDYFECVSLRCKELHLLEKYSEDVAINGQEGIRGVDRIDMTTSSGFPFNKMKKYFFESEGDGFKSWVPKEELRKLIDDCHDRYRQGKRCGFVFMGALKDEPRAFDKIASNNTRVFMGQNVAHLVIGRQYFGSFIRVMQRNRLDFECAIGTNTHSQDWDDIAHFIFDFAKNYFDGDYSKYDKEMLAFIIMLIFDGIIDFICKHCPDFSSTDRTVMRGVAYDIAYAFVNFNGDLVSFLRNNPSGHFLTVIINSICGSTYLRIGFVRATGLPVNRFRDLVRPVTYGDDVIVSVKDEIKHLFNFATYQRALQEFNIKFTPANKTGESYEFRSYDELDFLKRSFVVHEDLLRYCAPLALSSIYKSLVVGVRSKSITAEKQIVQVLSSAHREMYMHGRKAFDKFVGLTQRVLKAHDLHLYVGRNDFPSYEKLTEQYTSGESSMWLSSETKVIDYEFQSKVTYTRGEEDRLPNKTTGLYHGSHCTLSNSEKKSENGSWYLTYQGVPQNAYLGKDRLVSKIATLREGLVRISRSTNKTAQNYNNEFKVMDKTMSESTQPVGPTDFKQSASVETDSSINFKTDGQRSHFDESLNAYLKRPVLLATVPISTSTTTEYTMDVFSNWASKAQIKRKLTNYRMLKGSLHLKIVVDASSFVGGCYIAALSPGESVLDYPLLTDCYLSQKPHAFIDIGNNRDVELMTKVMHNTEYLDFEDYEGTAALFIKSIRSIYNVLTPSTNGNILIYGWMDDVEVRGATHYHLQSKVTVMSKQDTMSAHRTPEKAFFSDKNTDLVSTLPTSDMNTLIGRKVLIDTFNWDQTKLSGDLLRTYKVNPGCTKVVAGQYIDETPLSFFSRYFEFWKGSLTFTVRIIKTAQQSGALRLAWDPIGSPGPASIGIITSEVFNINETQEVTFDVPHENFLGYFRTAYGRGNIDQFSTTGYDEERDNGLFYIDVVSTLTSPNTSSAVTLMVFLEPGNDFEFGHQIKGPRYTSFQFQSKSTYIGETYTLNKILSRPEKVYVTPPMEGLGAYATYRVPMYPLLSGVHSKIVGEETIDFSLNTVPDDMLSNVVPPSAVPSGTVVKGVVTGQTMLARLMDAHVGIRGGMNWIVQLTGLEANFGPIANFGFSSDPTVSVNWQAPDSPASSKWDYLTQRGEYLADGRVMHSFYVNPILEVGVPYFSNKLYQKTRDATEWPCIALTIEPRASGVQFTLLASAAEDTELVQFRGFSRQYFPAPLVVAT